MGLFEKLFSGLSKSRKKMVELEALFQDYEPDDEDFYDDLEELLVLSDVGGEAAEEVVRGMKRLTWDKRYRRGEEAREGLIGLLTDQLNVGESELKLGTKPSVILMVGVNGVGKTTTIGKLANQFKNEGKRSCSWRAIPSAPPRPSSSISGRSAPVSISCAMRRGATPPPSSMTDCARPKPAAATSC